MEDTNQVIQISRDHELINKHDIVELTTNGRYFQGDKCYTRKGTVYHITNGGWRRMTPKKNKYGTR